MNRAGRFRSLGDGQVDFGGVFSKLTQYGFDGWAVVEWECCLKHPEDGAREGAEFVRAHMIRVTERPSTISRARGPTGRRTGGCWGWRPEMAIGDSGGDQGEATGADRPIRLGMVGAARAPSSGRSIGSPRGWTGSSS